MTDEVLQHYQKLAEHYEKKADMPFYTDDPDDPHWNCTNCGNCQEIKIFKRVIHEVNGRVKVTENPNEYVSIYVCKLAERETEETEYCAEFKEKGE